MRNIADPNLCPAYGPRPQPAGFVARLITGLYVPQINTGSAPEKSKD